MKKNLDATPGFPTVGTWKNRLDANRYHRRETVASVDMFLPIIREEARLSRMFVQDVWHSESEHILSRKMLKVNRILRGHFFGPYSADSRPINQFKRRTASARELRPE
jgi:hypothetical protein